MEHDSEVEEWKGIPRFGDYEVSSWGRIRSVRTGNVLRPQVHPRGYHKVTLYHRRTPYQRYVHQLVAQSFLPGYRERAHIRHLDDNYDNNHYKNLGMVRNRKYRVWRTSVRGGRPVRIIELDKTFVNAYGAARYIRGDVSCIYRVLSGQRDHHLGYTFEFADG